MYSIHSNSKDGKYFQISPRSSRISDRHQHHQFWFWVNVWFLFYKLLYLCKSHHISQWLILWQFQIQFQKEIEVHRISTEDIYINILWWLLLQKLAHYLWSTFINFYNWNTLLDGWFLALTCLCIDFTQHWNPKYWCNFSLSMVLCCHNQFCDISNHDLTVSPYAWWLPPN